MSVNPAAQSPEQELVNRLKTAERNINELASRVFGTASGGAVDSVFGRTGIVVAATNDYTWAQINKATSSLADITTRSAGDLSSGTLLDARLSANVPLKTDNLSVFAATTSAQLRTLLSDESGTGAAVFADSPTIITPTIASLTNAQHTHQNAAGGGTLDHGLALTGLTDDDHTQYATVGGRATPQTIAFGTASGANAGYLTSTAHATKGKYFLNAAGTMTVDDLNVRLGLRTASPGTYIIDIGGSGGSDGTFNTDTAITTTGSKNIMNLAPVVTSNSAAGNTQMIRAAASLIPAQNNSGTWYNLNNNIVVGSAAANNFNLSGAGYGQLIRLTTDSGYTGTITRFRNQFIDDAQKQGASTITNLVGLQIESLAGGTNNSCLFIGTGNNPTGNWGIYESATYDNVLRGNVRIGSTTAPTVPLDVTGAAKFSSTVAITGTTTLATSLTGPLKASSGVVSAADIDLATEVTDINALSADASPDSGADYVMTWDNSASAHKKVLLSNLPSATDYPSFIGYAVDTADRTTTSTTDGTATAIAALTKTFTAVGGAIYRVRAGQESFNSGANTNYIQIWEGTVGSGTKKMEKSQYNPAATGRMTHIVEYVGTLTAGSITVNVGIKTSAGTMTLEGDSPNSFLTIERLV